MERDRVDDGEAGMDVSAPRTETQRTRLLCLRTAFDLSQSLLLFHFLTFTQT